MQNLVKGIDMAYSQIYRDTRGRKVIDTDTLDAIVKGIGFQPAEVAATQRVLADEQSQINLVRQVKASIADDWARALANKDQEGVAQARTRLSDWNSKNPETPIRVDFAGIARRVREIKMSKEQRIERRAPKEIRRESF